MRERGHLACASPRCVCLQLRTPTDLPRRPFLRLVEFKDLWRSLKTPIGDDLAQELQAGARRFRFNSSLRSLIDLHHLCFPPPSPAPSHPLPLPSSSASLHARSRPHRLVRSCPTPYHDEEEGGQGTQGTRQLEPPLQDHQHASQGPGDRPLEGLCPAEPVRVERLRRWPGERGEREGKSLLYYCPHSPLCRVSRSFATVSLHCTILSANKSLRHGLHRHHLLGAVRFPSLRHLSPLSAQTGMASHGMSTPSGAASTPSKRRLSSRRLVPEGEGESSVRLGSPCLCCRACLRGQTGWLLLVLRTH